MNYNKEAVKRWAEEIYNTSKKSTTLSYIIPYSQIESFGPLDKDAQSDICEYIFEDEAISDEIQNIDFDDDNQRVVVMWYMPPSKEKIEEDKEMTYQETIRNAVQKLYDETKSLATSRHYTFGYGWVNTHLNVNLNDKQVRDDVWEMSYSDEFCDLIQTVDFDDDCKEVTVMLWKSNNKKRYTLKEWKEFCDQALTCPPFEDEDGWQKWIDEHKIQIVANNCEIELDYDADAINEIEFALREIYNAIHGDGTATTGNTVGSEYRDATWKDILRLNIMRLVYDGKSMKEAIKLTTHGFDSNSYVKCLREINNQTTYNDEFEVNFSRISSDDMEKLFEGAERRRAVKEMLCKNIQLSEMIDQNGAHDDKTVITDYSIHPAGHLVGWHYGVDWDVNSTVNQQYINDYIKEMVG